MKVDRLTPAFCASTPLVVAFIVLSNSFSSICKIRLSPQPPQEHPTAQCLWGPRKRGGQCGEVVVFISLSYLLCPLLWRGSGRSGGGGGGSVGRWVGGSVVL